MPIRFKCPNPKCQKLLSVKDQLAGKKVPCPACKQGLTIPSASSAPAPPRKAPAGPETGTTTDASPTTTNGVPDDVDELAMSLLADEPKPAAPVEQPKTLTTTCPYCDEQVQFDVALAGKQAPCPNPECRRIVKVPHLTKQAKVDWRNTASGLPSAARRPTEAAPEGAWGSTQKSYVSADALEEAGVLPSQQRDPLTKSQWAVRILMGGAGIGLVVAGVMFVLQLIGSKKKEKLFDKAMAAVSPKDGTIQGEDAAVVHYAAGIYHLRRKEKDSVKPDKGDAGAWNQFGMARIRLKTGPKGNPECFAMLIELALAQIELGGNPDQVSEGKRLAWPEVRRDVGVTLSTQIDNPDARAEGLRRVTRKLIEKGQAGLAEELAEQLSDGPGLFAVVGLEFKRAGEDARVQKLLKQVVAQLVAARPRPNVPPPPQVKVTSDLVAFLEVGDQAKELPKPTKEAEIKALKDITQVGHAVALAWQKVYTQARNEVRNIKTDALKVEALIAAADAPGDEGETKATVLAAMALIEEKFKAIELPEPGREQDLSPWAIVRLVPIGLRAGVEENRLLALAARIKDARLRGWAQLPVVRARLEREDKAEESLVDQVEKGTLANKLVRVELARHNTRKDSSTEKAIEGWDESLRPFGYIGVALGLQEGD